MTDWELKGREIKTGQAINLAHEHYAAIKGVDFKEKDFDDNFKALVRVKIVLITDLQEQFEKEYQENLENTKMIADEHKREVANEVNAEQKEQASVDEAIEEEDIYS